MFGYPMSDFPLCFLQPNERALLTMMVARLRQIDADVFVGHNFAAFDLDVLLHRLQHHKVRLRGPRFSGPKVVMGDKSSLRNHSAFDIA